MLSLSNGPLFVLWDQNEVSLWSGINELRWFSWCLHSLGLNIAVHAGTVRFTSRVNASQKLSWKQSPVDLNNLTLCCCEGYHSATTWLEEARNQKQMKQMYSIWCFRGIKSSHLYRGFWTVSCTSRRVFLCFYRMSYTFPQTMRSEILITALQ